jgi:hypothetical protein
LARPVAGVVLDIFCTTLLDAPHEFGVPAYVYLITSATMCALLLRSPALDEEVAVEFEEMEGGVDVPGLPPVPVSCGPACPRDFEKWTASGPNDSETEMPALAEGGWVVVAS